MHVLAQFDRQLLIECGCYFAGGTAIVLQLNEYRESVDIDFLCASAEGYRRLRNLVTFDSIDAICQTPMALQREVRMDQYGIRTWIVTDDRPIKLEIVREARIDLHQAAGDEDWPVPLLAREDLFTEKLLANTDRGLDRAVLSRDLIDLAMMIDSWGQIPEQAWQRAEASYGASVRRVYQKTLLLLQKPIYRRECLRQMQMDASLEVKILGALGLDIGLDQSADAQGFRDW
jgi:hypothetical protein